MIFLKNCRAFKASVHAFKFKALNKNLKASITAHFCNTEFTSLEISSPDAP